MIAAATALVAGVMTILMGVVANYPLALATGLGLNAFVAYVVAKEMTWADAMGLVVLEGLIILVLVLTGFRQAVFTAVPAQLKVAISVGIGLFIALIGLVDAGFVHRTPLLPTTTVPVTLGWDGQLQGWPVAVFVFGFLLLVALHARRVRGAILISIVATTLLAILVEKLAKIGGTGPFTVPGDDGQVDGSLYVPTAWGLSVPGWPSDVIAKPDFSLLGDFNLFGAWQNAGVVAAALFVFTLLLADFFDTLGTMTAIGAEGGPPRRGRQPAEHRADPRSSTRWPRRPVARPGCPATRRTSRAPRVSPKGRAPAWPPWSPACCSCWPRSSRRSSRSCRPRPPYPALVLVGFLMMQQVRGIDWEDLEIALPAFLTIVIMPFTYSISAGIGAGFITYVFLKVVRGKAGRRAPADVGRGRAVRPLLRRSTR